MKVKRVPRKKPKEHKELDIMKPLQFEKLGSVDDPCFGKLYSAKAPECKRCGDSETCAACSTGTLLNEINKIEQEQPFKDVDEGNLVDKQNLEISELMVKKASKDTDKYYSLEKLIPKLREKFNLTAKDDKVLLQRCIKAASDHKKLKLNKQLTKYKIK